MIYFFHIPFAKILIAWQLLGADRLGSAQNLAYKGVKGKILRNIDLALFLCTHVLSTTMVEFARTRLVCAFGFCRVKVVRHNGSERAVEKAQFAGQSAKSGIFAIRPLKYGIMLA